MRNLVLILYSAVILFFVIAFYQGNIVSLRHEAEIEESQQKILFSEMSSPQKTTGKYAESFPIKNIAAIGETLKTFVLQKQDLTLQTADSGAQTAERKLQLREKALAHIVAPPPPFHIITPETFPSAAVALCTHFGLSQDDCQRIEDRAIQLMQGGIVGAQCGKTAESILPFIGPTFGNVEGCSNDCENESCDPGNIKNGTIGNSTELWDVSPGCGDWYCPDKRPLEECRLKFAVRGHVEAKDHEECECVKHDIFGNCIEEHCWCEFDDIYPVADAWSCEKKCQEDAEQNLEVKCIQKDVYGNCIKWDREIAYMWDSQTKTCACGLGVPKEGDEQLFHAECNQVSKTCELVPGPGPNKCTVGDSAVCQKTSHLECNLQTQQCVSVPGPGLDTCSTNAECIPPTDCPLQPGTFRISDDYNCPMGKKDGECNRPLHSGVDLVNVLCGGVTLGMPVFSIITGTATVDWNDLCGNRVEITGEEIKVRYCHLATTSVTSGQQVSRGTKVGTVGSTGLSTGPHLHVTIIKNGLLIDPKNIISCIANAPRQCKQLPTDQCTIVQEGGRIKLFTPAGGILRNLPDDAQTRNCMPENLTAFDTIAPGLSLEAAQICLQESGGDPGKLNSSCTMGADGVDNDADGLIDLDDPNLDGGTYDFSVGLFQHNLLIRCPSAFQSQQVGNWGWCKVINQSLMNQCSAEWGQFNKTVNIDKAVWMRKSWGNWGAWKKAATNCNLPI